MRQSTHPPPAADWRLAPAAGKAAGAPVAASERPLAARWAAALFSFETLFLLYLGAGRYKGMPEFSWFPIDFTLFFLVASIGAAVLLSAHRINLLAALEDYGTLCFAAFLGWVLLSLLWSSFSEINRIKLANTAILLSWSFLGGYLVVAASYARLRRFLIGLVIFSVALLLYWAHRRFVLGIVDVRPEEEINNYLVYGYHAQYVAAALVAGAVASRGAFGLASCMTGFAAILVTMLFIGGRGPLIFALLLIPLAFALLLSHPKASFYRSRFLTVVMWVALLAVVLQLLVLWLGPYLVEQLSDQMTTISRLTSALDQSDLGASVSEREEGQRFAFEHWLQAPVIGWGVGEFGHLFPSLKYPHNLFLEILMEQGLIGFWLLVALIGLGLVRAWRLWPARPDWVPIALILMFVTLLMSRATVQGYLPDERLLFALLGIILGLGQRAVARRTD